MQLANQAVATTRQVGRSLSFRCRIRNVSSANDGVCSRNVSMRVGSFNRRSVDDKTQQQEGDHARKRVMTSG